MRLPPYEIPEQDADLWACGVVLTERARMSSAPLPPLNLEARRASLAAASTRAARARRANYVEWLRDRIAGRTDPSRVSYQPTPAEAIRCLETRRARWGDAEYEIAEATVAKRMAARMLLP